MKSQTIVKPNFTVTAFAVSIVMVGCQKEDSSGQESNSSPRREIVEQSQSERTSQKMKEVVASGQDMAKEAKPQFLAAANQTLKEVDAVMNDLNQRAF